MGAQLSRSAIDTGHAIGGNGDREIAVALSGATPTIIDEAHALWLPKSVPKEVVESFRRRGWSEAQVTSAYLSRRAAEKAAAVVS